VVFFPASDIQLFAPAPLSLFTLVSPWSLCDNYSLFSLLRCQPDLSGFALALRSRSSLWALRPLVDVDGWI